MAYEYILSPNSYPCAASSTGVCPSLLVTEASAPSSIRTWTQSRCPLWAARCSAVHSSFSWKMEKYMYVGKCDKNNMRTTEARCNCPLQSNLPMTWLKRHDVFWYGDMLLQFEQKKMKIFIFLYTKYVKKRLLISIFISTFQEMFRWKLWIFI